MAALTVPQAMHRLQSFLGTAAMLGLYLDAEPSLFFGCTQDGAFTEHSLSALQF
jgi:hypothetical protein